MKRIHAALWLQVESNMHHPPGARPGSVIDGAADIGKSTIVTQFGRAYEGRLRARYPGELTEDGDEFLPALYLTLASRTSIKGLDRQILEFFGHPYAPRATQGELTMQVQNVARRCRTTLFIIDDIHYLKLGNQSDREVNDHLKHLASVIPATFVYAGIGCEEVGLLREGRSPSSGARFSQTGSRFSLHRIDRFNVDTEGGTREWIALLAALETELVLMKSFNGMLSNKLRNYLFDRTHGEIGSLTALLRQGALLAINRGDEHLTSALLDEIELSYDAEGESQRRGTRMRHSTQDGDARGQPKTYAAPMATPASA
jgi:hypothetical protein